MAGAGTTSLREIACDGQVVGPHLALLSNYFPGYHVSWPGALVGLGYGAMSGAVAGWSVAWVYNLVVAIRQRR